MSEHTRPALCNRQEQGHAAKSVRGLNKEEGNARVKEPFVLGTGKGIEVVLDSRILIVRTAKLCFSVSTQ